MTESDRPPGSTLKPFGSAAAVDPRPTLQRTKPYTPRHNGKAERYQRILTEEVLYARAYTCEDERSAAIGVWNIH